MDVACGCGIVQDNENATGVSGNEVIEYYWPVEIVLPEIIVKTPCESAVLQYSSLVGIMRP